MMRSAGCPATLPPVTRQMGKPSESLVERVQMVISEPHASNGASAPDRLTRMVAELQEMADDYALEVAEAQVALDEAKTKAAGIQKAIAVLTGESARPPKRQRKSSSSSQHGWRPSEEKVSVVLAAFEAAADEPLTITEVTRRVDVSREVVVKSVERLREDEKIRFVGTGRGGGKRYSLMPNG